MEAAFHLRAAPDGLAKPFSNSTEARMSNGSIIESTNTLRHILWTAGLWDCIAVATYDPATEARTLVQLEGGITTPSYFPFMARILSSESTVIIVGGNHWSHAFTSDYADKYRNSLEVEMRKLGMTVPKILIYLSNANPNLLDGTFVFKDDGEYGSINPQLCFPWQSSE